MKPIRRERCDISRDKIIPDEFKKYVAEHKYVAKKYVVNNSGESIYEFEHPDTLTSAEYRRFVDELIRLIKTNLFGWLIQFWRAKEIIVNNSVVGERRFLLTLRNQPFLLGSCYSNGKIDDRICRYRTKMHDVIVNGDGTGGPIGRVFRNNRMEFTPNVSYYSDNEYPQPQRDITISDVSYSLVLSWLDSSGLVVGAIEFVSPLTLPLVNRLPSIMLCKNSLYPDYCIRLCGQYDSEKNSLISAVTEINEMIGEIFKRGDLVCAQTWMLCKHCSSLSSVSRCAQELKSLSKYFINNEGSIFLAYQDYYNLKKGEGVVGNAAESSHDLVYCESVAEFSITEYPLAHLARCCKLSASFAISLKSNQTGDQVYVLEFFLRPDYVKGKNLMATLVPILEKIRQCFKTFKFASGEDIRESFSVKVIDAHSPDKVETLRNEKLDLTLTVGSYNYKASDFRHNMERFRRWGDSSRPSFLQSSIGESSTEETDDLMTIVETPLQDISMEDAPIASASTVQCEIRVTIKATYGVDSISFQLSASSGIYELYRQVCQRLQLADTTFDLKYLDDDNDLIELTCDEDLQLYISSSMEQENYNLLVFVVPR